MPPVPNPSNIRANVRWREPSVYAGEDIECIITFKNIASVPGQEPRDETSRSVSNGFPQRQRSEAQQGSHSRRSSVAQGKPATSKAPSVGDTNAAQAGKGHRPTLSLNVVSGPSKGGLQSAPIPAKAPMSAVKPATGHGRSLSIMSLGSDVTSEGHTAIPSSASKRPGKGHVRSASLQVMPKPSPRVSPYISGPSPRQPSPLFETTTPPPLMDADAPVSLPKRSTRRKSGTISTGNTPQSARQNSIQASPHVDAFDPTFQFPSRQASAVKPPSPQPVRADPSRSPSKMHSSQSRPISPRPPEGWSGALSNLNPISRVMSETSTAGTPRSSGEFYSMSNHSDETLMSELPYQNQTNGRLLPRPSQFRQTSSRTPSAQQRTAKPETLMMAYAQTMGYFVLDGSLVNAAPFEEVKRKGVQTGGGVVGVQRAKNPSGMFGAFSWGNIGESLGGLLGNDEMGSMAQMKASAGSKSIPLLSTPQNLLFVDLKLAPGESKSFNYRFTLPRGLPPSYRGRAIKVSYHLALGVQRPQGQAVKRVEAPFRVLGSYNARGETLGHDLMSPYILLQDAAKSTSITPDPSAPFDSPKFTAKRPPNQSKSPQRGLEDFLRYSERLLEEPKDSHGALLSPTTPTTPSAQREESISDQPASSVKDAVDFAILRANYTSSSSKQKRSEAQSANRFNIARSGQLVAVLTLLRPAYRLGEAVIGAIDFTAPSNSLAQAASYSVLAELESSERVDASLALRSSNSINRVTRRAHAAIRENALYARQISFSLTVPTTATPSFETTGVSLVWKLRVEFTTQRQTQGLGLDGVEKNNDDLMEELGSDERGTTLIARERLMAESFEIEVPLKVYGAPGIDASGGESEALEV